MLTSIAELVSQLEWRSTVLLLARVFLEQGSNRKLGHGNSYLVQSGIRFKRKRIQYKTVNQQ